MSFLRFKLIVSAIASILLLSRISCMAVFYYFGDYEAAFMLAIGLCVAVLALFGFYLIARLNLARRLYLLLKNRIYLLQQRPGWRLKIYRAAYYFIIRNRLHDSSRLKNLLWICFEIEVISTCLVFVYLRGWGYGFEFFLVVIFSYFYMHFRFKNRKVLLLPISLAALYIWLFISAAHPANSDSTLQFIIYLINGCSALVMLFSVQMISEIGRVIKVINDTNRAEYIRSLSSYDALSGALAKYSFLDVASARLEYNPEDEIITQASVILIEFANLSAINRQYTMQIGDMAIKEFASLISQKCENYDCLIARWSGDQFLIFLLSEDAKTAQMLGEQITHTAAFNRFSIKGIRINAEFAVASSSDFSYEISELIDTAMHRLKEKTASDEED